MSDARAPERLRDLEARLRDFKAKVEPRNLHDPSDRPMGPGFAFEIAGHLVGGLLLGGGIGYGLDLWLGTSPLLLVVFFFMGAAAGMVNIYRTVTGLGLAAGYHPAPAVGGTETLGGGAGGTDQDGKQGEG